jgi:hypothetical protein
MGNNLSGQGMANSNFFLILGQRKHILQMDIYKEYVSTTDIKQLRTAVSEAKWR